MLSPWKVSQVDNHCSDMRHFLQGSNVWCMNFYLNVSHVHLSTLLSEICREAGTKTVNQKGWYQF